MLDRQHNLYRTATASLQIGASLVDLAAIEAADALPCDSSDQARHREAIAAIEAGDAAKAISLLESAPAD